MFGRPLYHFRVPMVARFARWYEYEKESHAKVVASLEQIDLVQRDEPAFQKALELLAHVAAARRLWLSRLGVTKEGPKSGERQR